MKIFSDARWVSLLGVVWIGLSACVGERKLDTKNMEQASITDAIKVVAPTEFHREALRLPEKTATPTELAHWLKEKSVYLLDVRSAEEFAQSHIQGAISLPLTDITEKNFA